MSVTESPGVSPTGCASEVSLGLEVPDAAAAAAEVEDAGVDSGVVAEALSMGLLASPVNGLSALDWLGATEATAAEYDDEGLVTAAEDTAAGDIAAEDTAAEDTAADGD